MPQQCEREGKGDTVSERETGWGQSATGQGKPKAGSHNASRNGGVSADKHRKHCLAPSLRATGQKCRDMIAERRHRKGISVRDHHTVQIQTQHGRT